MDLFYYEGFSGSDAVVRAGPFLIHRVSQARATPTSPLYTPNKDNSFSSFVLVIMLSICNQYDVMFYMVLCFLGFTFML